MKTAKTNRYYVRERIQAFYDEDTSPRFLFPLHYSGLFCLVAFLVPCGKQTGGISDRPGGD